MDETTSKYAYVLPPPLSSKWHGQERTANELF